MPSVLFRAGSRHILLFVVVIFCACGPSASGGGDDTPVDAFVDGTRPDSAHADAAPIDATVDICGDGLRGVTEACDDDNADGGDGCSADCLEIEVGYRCPIPGAACVANVCGDRRIDPPETCEDGDAVGGDGCSDTCTLEPGWRCPLVGAACSAAECGDGIVAGFEQCDDHDSSPGDGCSATCSLEPGWHCPTDGADCARTVCGDRVVQGTEQCDNDLAAAGSLPLSFDGCDSYCALEPSCTGGACARVCGDGIILPIPGQEACDDGNLRDGDGCSGECVIETGFACALQPTPPPASIAVPLTVRDFRGADLVGGHADFERAGAGSSQIRFGVVAPALTAGRPTFRAGYTPQLPLGDPTSASFPQWYAAGSDVKTVTRELSLQRIGTSSSYQFDSTNQGFFPIDGAGWADPAVPADLREPTRATDGTVNVPGQHNFSFTTETHFWFQYDGTEVLTFSGDDDLYVFVNGILCLDVGGLHSRRTVRMDLANPATSSVIKESETVEDPQSDAERAIVRACKDQLEAIRIGLGYSPLFEVSIFHAERHTEASNFRLTLNNFIKTSSSCASTCGDGIVASDEVCDLGPGMNDGGYNGCLGCTELGPYCGDGRTTSPPETCDDGVNAGGYDVCGPACTIDQYCGDGIRQPQYEQCDAGAANGQGACTATCTSRVD